MNVYRILGNFRGAKFLRNKNLRKIFSRIIHVCNKRCGMAIISRLSKNREICENLVPRKFPGIRYNMFNIDIVIIIGTLSPFKNYFIDEVGLSIKNLCISRASQFVLVGDYYTV